jgi:uncharacterized protein YuzE
MRFELDTEARSAYLRVKDGSVSSTRDLSSLVFADMDRSGDILGIEFVGPDALHGAAELLAHVIHVPSEIDYTVNAEKDFDVEAVGGLPEGWEVGTARLHVAFAGEILSGAQNLNDIPTDSLIILVESGNTQELGHLVDLAEQRRRGERPVILRPLDASLPDRSLVKPWNTDVRTTGSSRGLLLHLDGDVLDRLDRIANAKGVDATSIAKRWIEEGIQHETQRDPRLAS